VEARDGLTVVVDLATSSARRLRRRYARARPARAMRPDTHAGAGLGPGRGIPGSLCTVIALSSTQENV
jgi:hypothetical protein